MARAPPRSGRGWRVRDSNTRSSSDPDGTARAPGSQDLRSVVAWYSWELIKTQELRHRQLSIRAPVWMRCTICRSTTVVPSTVGPYWPVPQFAYPVPVLIGRVYCSWLYKHFQVGFIPCRLVPVLLLVDIDLATWVTQVVLRILLYICTRMIVYSTRTVYTYWVIRNTTYLRM